MNNFFFEKGNHILWKYIKNKGNVVVDTFLDLLDVVI